MLIASLNIIRWVVQLKQPQVPIERRAVHRLFTLNNLYVKQLLGLGEIFLNRGLKDIGLD